MNEKQVMILVLASGTEIVASVDVDGASFIATEALEILRHMDETGAQRMGLAPWLPYADQAGGISIPLSTTIMAIPGKELRDAHSRAFSKIITADSSLILPS